MDNRAKKEFLREFGILFTGNTFLFQQLINRSNGERRIALADKLNEYKLKRLEYEFSGFIEQEAEKWRWNKKEYRMEKIVWNFWHQGNEDDIPIVHACMESVKYNCPKEATVITITKDNLQEYIQLPDYILKKVSNGIISLTQLSDILRMSLVSERGGCWLDATIFSVRDYSYVFEKSFWSTKREANNIYIPKGKWTGFAFSASKNSIVPTLMKCLFYEYWKRYDVLIDFFLIDLFLELLYRHVPEVKNIIDENNYNNEGVHKLWQMLPEIFNEKEYNQVTSDTDFFKLSWRVDIPKMMDGKLTVLGKICEKEER